MKMPGFLLLLASLLGASCFAAVDVPYGVCAHVTRSERSVARLKGTLDAMDLAGMKYVRSDFDAKRVICKDGTWDFSDYDALVADLERRGVTLLPILYAEENPPKDLKRYREYIQKVVRHYGRKFPVVEIWNEPNLDGFFRGHDPVHFAQTLKVAYESVKSVDPCVRVAFGGTAGVPFDWIRKVYESGAAKSFDIMAIHPYSHPHRPEGAVDVNVEKLKAMMTEFGVGDKPIWITEVGWPTHSQSIASPHILLAGLKVARPEQKSWRVIVADVKLEGPAPDQTVAEMLKDALPVGSTAVVCTQRETIRRLAAGEADAVVYPFDEFFPSETIGAVNEFIRTGGVLVEFGGMPCYNGLRDTESVKGLQGGAAIVRFPFGSRAWWMDPKGKYPETARLFATPAGTAAGVKQEPTGFKAMRFLVPERIGQDSEWIPLVAGKGADGTELVCAAVVRYHGERTGAAVLCSLMASSSFVTNDEENQARFTVRCAGLAVAEGVEGYFPYNLRAFENDPYYSEDHFGLTHADFTPKPAYAAYAHFTRERPVGSVNLQTSWHDADRVFYFPQWKRPDGKTAGMLWTTESTERRRVRFEDGVPEFRNMYGRKMGGVRQSSDGVYELALSGSPIYFSGARLAQCLPFLQLKQKKDAMKK